MENRSIAIDGPSGAGKSTLSRLLANHFGMIYVDTGALYRSIGLFALKNGVASKDLQGVTNLLPLINIEMVYDDSGTQKMYLNGEDVSAEIRLPEISIYASDVSAMPPVREFLLDTQRVMADKYDVIMDGRDIGTVVLPNAGLKIFLTATPESRAQRRFEELCERSLDTSYDEVLRDISYRDKNDSSRAAAPLKAADDAVVLNTTGFSLEKSFSSLKKIIKEHFDI